MHVGRRSKKSHTPKGFLPIYSVGSKHEADELTLRAKKAGLMADYRGEHEPRKGRYVAVAVELSMEQDLQKLYALSAGLDALHNEMITDGVCDCVDPHRA